MVLIVGLGNPGEKYRFGRHNVGFMVVDELARKLLPLGKTEWRLDKRFNSEFIIRNSKFILAKPQTMMNASGFAVAKILRYYDIKILSNLWVIHDDLDLPLGKIKIVRGRGSAGHHGVTSIISQLGSADFVRFRVGIGHPAKEGKWMVGKGRLVSENVPRQEVEDYVLEEFGGKEKIEAKKTILKTTAAIRLALEKELEEAMNRYNS